MKISIITPSFNHAAYIEDTIRSVQEQGAGDIEHIVIDGGSTDGTVDILRRYSSVQWISEPDRGQAHAINKGFARSTGDIMTWINSDDYYKPGVLPTVEKYFVEHPECQVLYGDVTYVDEGKHELYTLQGAAITLETLRRSPDIVRQPSIFWRRRAMKTVGTLDERLHVVMDYEFFLRLAERFEFHYVPLIVSCFRDYHCNKTHVLMKKQAYELFRVSVRHHCLDAAMAKFLFGRYLDGCGRLHPAKILLTPLRKSKKT